MVDGTDTWISAISWGNNSTMSYESVSNEALSNEAVSNETMSQIWRGDADFGNWCYDFGCDWFFVDDSVESLDWIGGVFNDTTGAIRFNQGV